MQAYLNEQATPFHTPGHKMGKGAPESLKNLLGTRALAMDLTVVPGLGDLFDRSGPIQEAQILAARLYGADASYFLVNGTTCGIYAMILATVGPGDKIIMPRNVHRSVLGGLILSGAVPVFVRPEFDPELQITMNVDAAVMEEAMLAHPDAKAVLLTNPTYYGVSADIRRILDFAHARSLPVLVDEAHGPHLHFASDLPLSALDAGADMVVQSTHKLLGSLSQTSLLHCRSGRISVQRLETMLQLVQSSSPNYLLLASLEAAVAQMSEAGRNLTKRTVQLARQARANINRIPGLYCFGQDRVGRAGIFDLDATKLTVTVKGLGMRGNDAALRLRFEGGVQVELSDWNNVLFLVTIGDDEASLDRLMGALSILAAKKAPCAPEKLDGDFLVPDITAVQALSPREAVFSPHARVDFGASAGRICAETVVSYPPGIPLLMPGERMMPEMISYCLTLRDRGFVILGPEDPALNTIGVVA